MNKKFVPLLLALTIIFISLPYAFSETGGSTKIDCSILSNEGGTKLLAPSGNTGTVGIDIILGCMGLPGAFTGDDTLALSGSTGNGSIATVFPFSNNIIVNPDGGTDVINFSIMILSAGSTDIAVDFGGAMNFDVNSTLWTFKEPSAGGSGGSSMSGSSTSSSSGSTSSSNTSSSSSGSSTSSMSASLCSAAINGQCATGSSRKDCNSCCSSVAAIAEDKKCKSKCKKKCKKLK